MGVANSALGQFTPSIRIQQALRQIGRDDVMVDVRPGRSWNPLWVTRQRVVVYQMLIDALPDTELRALLQYDMIRSPAVVWRLIGLCVVGMLWVVPLVVGDLQSRWMIASSVALGVGTMVVITSDRAWSWVYAPKRRRFHQQQGNLLALHQALWVCQEVACNEKIPWRALPYLAGHLRCLAGLAGVDADEFLGVIDPEGTLAAIEAALEPSWWDKYGDWVHAAVIMGFVIWRVLIRYR